MTAREISGNQALFRGSNLDFTQRIVPPGGVIIMVFCDESGTRGVSEINLISDAHFVERLRRFPSLGIPVWAISSQVDIG